MLRLLTLIIPLLLVAAGCDVLPGDGPTTVRGTVRDAVTGLPIDSIYVALEPPGTARPVDYALTAQDGTYELSSGERVTALVANSPPQGMGHLYDESYRSFLTPIVDGSDRRVSIALEPSELPE